MLQLALLLQSCSARVFMCARLLLQKKKKAKSEA